LKPLIPWLRRLNDDTCRNAVDVFGVRASPRTPLTRIRCRRHLPILLRLVPLALKLGTSSALAFDTSKLGQWGSLPLEDLASVIAKSARLQQEISQVLSEGNKKQEDVTCLGMRFPGQWKHLGGLRVSPYACDFGAMWLQIRA